MAKELKSFHAMAAPTPTPLLPAPPRHLVPIQPRLLDASGSYGFNASAVQAQARAATAAKDAQRRRHRLAVQRSYYAKLERGLIRECLSALREQERALMKQYEDLLRRQQPPGDRDSQATDARALYLKLTDVRYALEQENASLLKATAMYRQFMTRTRLAALAEGVVVASENDGNDSSATQSSPVVKIKPLSLDECLDVIHECWPQVYAFRYSRTTLQSSTTVFGWTHRYRVSPAVDSTSYKLQYSISKTFCGHTAVELCDRGWEIMTTQRHYQSLHSSTMTSQLYPVQRIDADSIVFLRILQRPGQSTVFKTLLLGSRFQINKGMLTIFRGLDPARIVGVDLQGPKSKNVVWLEMFSWTYFEDHDDGSSVHFEFGGEMRHTSNDNAHFWMMEVLLMALRWENMAVGPLFKLTNG